MTEQNPALRRARHALGILEGQAAGYTALTIPANVVIEIEEKRKEIARLEGIAEEGQEAFSTNNLPRRRPFFGREKEIARALAALDPDDRGWGVMIDGIGGIGKTALAVEVAYLAYERAKFDVVLFTTAKKVRLTATDEQPVVGTARALEAMLGGLARDLGQPNVAQRTGAEQRRAFLAFLRRYSSREQRILLIFDNLETLPRDDLSPLFDLLRHLPQPCKAIVTSRRRAGAGGVWLRLAKLSWPAARELIADRVERSLRLQRTLAWAGKNRWKELYTATGGSPLALHWTLGLMQQRNLSVNRALALLQEGTAADFLLEFIYREARQDMSDDDWRVLGALALFAAPATFEALGAVTGLLRLALESALERLDAYALVDVEGVDGPYTLHPLTRRLAADELATRTEIIAPLRDGFTRYWVDYAQHYGGWEKNAYRTHDRLEAEWPNLEAAAVLLYEQLAESEAAVRSLNRLSDALYSFLWFRGYWEEVVRLNRSTHGAMSEFEEWRDAGVAAYRIAWIHYNRAETEAAARWAEQMTEDMARGGNRRDQAEATRLCGLVARQRGDFEAAKRLYTEALDTFSALGEKASQTIVLKDLGEVALKQEEYARAEECYLKVLAVDEQQGDKEGQAIDFGNLGVLALDQGRVAEAREWFERALPLANQVGRQDLIAQAKWRLARVWEEEGRVEEALPLAREALKIHERLGHRNVRSAWELVARLEQGREQANGECADGE
ncbi:MAG: tetratricopeptide repeat protein [Chloroflexota bacterium]|nr:tetratricopeptide repeat protein [Chloroflexota bacterium]